MATLPKSIARSLAGAAADRAVIATQLAAHTAEDARRFDEMSTKLDNIGKDVKSLLESRTFTRGMAKMAMITAGGISALVSLVIAYLRGH